MKRGLLIAGLIFCTVGLATSRSSVHRVRRASDPWNLSLWGSYKSIAALQQHRQQGVYPNDKVPLTEQRLRIGGALTKDWFRLEVANEVLACAQVPNAPRLPLPSSEPAPAFDATLRIASSDELSLVNRLDRAFAQAQFDDLEITVGKQVVAMGVGRIFSAVSQTRRRSFLFVDPEYPVTEDAVFVSWQGPVLIEGRFLPRTETERGHNFHVRIGERSPLFDLMLTLGRSDDKALVAVEAAANLDSFVLRGELAGYDWEGGSRFQAILGYDQVYSSQWSAEAEIFYNGFGVASSSLHTAAPPVHRSAPALGQWYAGGKVTYEATPLLKGALSAVLNLVDPSALLHLSLSYAVTQTWDILVGQFIGIASQAHSEFGGTLPLAPGFSAGIPDLSYVVLRMHF